MSRNACNNAGTGNSQGRRLRKWPAASTRVCVEVLRIEEDPAEVAHWLELIAGAADHCDRVVQEMEPLST